MKITLEPMHLPTVSYVLAGAAERLPIHDPLPPTPRPTAAAWDEQSVSVLLLITLKRPYHVQLL